MRAAAPAGLPFATTAFPLTDVERAWASAVNGPRVLFRVS